MLRKLNLIATVSCAAQNALGMLERTMDDADIVGEKGMDRDYELQEEIENARADGDEARAKRLEHARLKLENRRKELWAMGVSSKFNAAPEVNHEDIVADIFPAPHSDLTLAQVADMPPTPELAPESPLLTLTAVARHEARKKNAEREGGAYGFANEVQNGAASGTKRSSNSSPSTVKDAEEEFRRSYEWDELLRATKMSSDGGNPDELADTVRTEMNAGDVVDADQVDVALLPAAVCPEEIAHAAEGNGRQDGGVRSVMALDIGALHEEADQEACRRLETALKEELGSTTTSTNSVRGPVHVSEKYRVPEEKRKCDSPPLERRPPSPAGIQGILPTESSSQFNLARDMGYGRRRASDPHVAEQWRKAQFEAKNRRRPSHTRSPAGFECNQRPETRRPSVNRPETRRNSVNRPETRRDSVANQGGLSGVNDSEEANDGDYRICIGGRRLPAAARVEQCDESDKPCDSAVDAAHADLFLRSGDQHPGPHNGQHRRRDPSPHRIARNDEDTPVAVTPLVAQGEGRRFSGGAGVAQEEDDVPDRFKGPQMRVRGPPADSIKRGRSATPTNRAGQRRASSADTRQRGGDHKAADRRSSTPGRQQRPFSVAGKDSPISGPAVNARRGSNTRPGAQQPAITPLNAAARKNSRSSVRRPSVSDLRSQIPQPNFESERSSVPQKRETRGNTGERRKKASEGEEKKQSGTNSLSAARRPPMLELEDNNDSVVDQASDERPQLSMVREEESSTDSSPEKKHPAITPVLASKKEREERGEKREFDFEHLNIIRARADELRQTRRALQFTQAERGSKREKVKPHSHTLQGIEGLSTPINTKQEEASTTPINVEAKRKGVSAAHVRKSRCARVERELAEAEEQQRLARQHAEQQRALAEKAARDDAEQRKALSTGASTLARTPPLSPLAHRKPQRSGGARPASSGAAELRPLAMKRAAQRAQTVSGAAAAWEDVAEVKVEESKVAETDSDDYVDAEYSSPDFVADVMHSRPAEEAKWAESTDTVNRSEQADVMSEEDLAEPQELEATGEQKKTNAESAHTGEVKWAESTGIEGKFEVMDVVSDAPRQLKRSGEQKRRAPFHEEILVEGEVILENLSSEKNVGISGDNLKARYSYDEETGYSMKPRRRSPMLRTALTPEKMRMHKVEFHGHTLAKQGAEEGVSATSSKPYGFGELLEKDGKRGMMLYTSGDRKSVELLDDNDENQRHRFHKMASNSRKGFHELERELGRVAIKELDPHPRLGSPSQKHGVYELYFERKWRPDLWRRVKSERTGTNADDQLNFDVTLFSKCERHLNRLKDQIARGRVGAVVNSLTNLIARFPNSKLTWDQEKFYFQLVKLKADLYVLTDGAEAKRVNESAIKKFLADVLEVLKNENLRKSLATPEVFTAFWDLEDAREAQVFFFRYANANHDNEYTSLEEAQKAMRQRWEAKNAPRVFPIENFNAETLQAVFTHLKAPSRSGEDQIQGGAHACVSLIKGKRDSEGYVVVKEHAQRSSLMVNKLHGAKIQVHLGDRKSCDSDLDTPEEERKAG